MSDNHEHEEPRIDEPGRQLRQRRESAGFSLQDISDKTLISVFRLQALENQDFDNIGGRAYLAGYTRAYAKVLGIDSEAYVRAFESLLAAEQGKQDPLLENSAAPPSGLPPRIWFAVVAVLFLALVVGGLLLIGDDFWGRRVSDEEVVPPITQREVMTQSTARSVTTSSDDSIAAQVEPETEIDRPFASMQHSDAAPMSQADNVVEESVAPSQQNAVVESAAVPPENIPVADLTLNFSSECWVEVSDASGAVLAARLAQSGDDLQLSGTPPFDIKLGNARAVEVRLDGSPVQVPVRAGRNTSRFTVGQRL